MGTDAQDKTTDAYHPAEWYHNKFTGKASAGGAVFEAYKMAMDVRKFEIELYWKRATYFWAFIVVAFGAYGATLTARNIAPAVQSDALFISAYIGTVLAVALYFVNRGSKFWQRNWEYQVDLLEDAAVGPLYKHVFAKEKDSFWHMTSAYPFSVSNINTILSLFFVSVFTLLAAFNSGLHLAPGGEISGPKAIMAILAGGAIWRLYKDGHTNAMKQRSDKNDVRVKKADVKVYCSVREVRVAKESSDSSGAAA